MNEVWVCRHCKEEQEGIIEAISEKGCCANGDCSLDGDPCDAKRFVEERVGRWEGIIKTKGKQIATCSVCNGVSTYHVTTAFCPHCGAKMEVSK